MRPLAQVWVTNVASRGHPPPWLLRTLLAQQCVVQLLGRGAASPWVHGAHGARILTSAPNSPHTPALRRPAPFTQARPPSTGRQVRQGARNWLTCCG